METERRLPPAIFLMGPTASGKTESAIRICESFPCEIISVDSALIYKGMDIGTAKPTAAELARAPHRLIDFLDPAEAYSAADFRRDALKHMAQITSSGKIPLLVGGTMMYFKALRQGMANLPSANPRIRHRLEEEAAEKGWEYLHDRLAEVDPKSAERIHPNDPQRLQRALEVYEITGKSLTELWSEQVPEIKFAPSEVKNGDYSQWSRDSFAGLPYNVTSYAVCPEPRAVLHERIEQRFDQMLDHGLVDEVRRLYERGDLSLSLPSMRSVGYRQVWEFLEGRCSYEEMRHRGVVATRQLAKRQITWLRSWPNLTWVDSFHENFIDELLKLIEHDIIERN